MGLGFSNLMLRSAANVGSLKPRSANETVALVADVVKPKLREKVSCFGGEDSRESVDRQFECETGRCSLHGRVWILTRGSTITSPPVFWPKSGSCLVKTAPIEITLEMMRQSLTAAVVSDALDGLGHRSHSPS